MNFRQLEAFRHVILTGTTKEAASRMFISQPAISRLIIALEEELGFTLFNRIKGRLQPNTAGGRFYDAVEQNFLGLERLDRTAERIRRSEPRELKIACTPALSATLLPIAIKAFRVHHPTIMINVDTVIVTDLLKRIQQMRVDLAVTLAFPPITGIEMETLLETENYCAMSISHPLASKGVIVPEDLVGIPLLKTLPTGPLTWEEEEQIFQQADVEPKIRSGLSYLAHGLRHDRPGPLCRLDGTFRRPTLAQRGYATPVSSAVEIDLRLGISLSTDTIETDLRFSRSCQGGF